MNQKVYKSLLLGYTISSSILFGGLFGFLVIYPFLQVMFDVLNISFGYDEPLWVHYLIYTVVIMSIALCMLINKKRYEKHLHGKGFC